MKRFAKWFGAVVVGAVLYSLCGAEKTAVQIGEAEVYMVFFKDTDSFNKFTANMPSIGLFWRSVPALNMVEISLAPYGVEMVKEYPGVELVAENGSMHIDDPMGDPIAVDEMMMSQEGVVDQDGSIIPAGVIRVGARDAWARGATGGGIKVCVIDTGVDPNHPALAGVIVGSRNFSKTGNAKGDDDHGHGTHVAATIAGQRGKGQVVGVAPNAKILSAKVCTKDGECMDDDIAAGIGWCLENGARVLSISLGDPNANEGLRRAVEIAIKKGVYVNASAGNSGRDIGYPAKLPGVFAWGANGTYYGRDCSGTKKPYDSDDLATFSSRGPELFGTAPGVCVLSAKLGGGYVRYSGTSMACPHASGTVALLLSQYPDATPEQIRQALKQTSTRLPEEKCNNEFGCGIPQAGAALNRLGRYTR